MRYFITAIFFTLLAASVFAQTHTPAAIPRPATGGQSRPTTTTSRPVSLAAALSGRLAVLRSVDGRASYVPGQFADVSSIAVTPDGRSIMVGPRDCEKNWIEQVDIATGAVSEFVGGADFPVVNGKGVVAVRTESGVVAISSKDAKGLVAYAIRCDGEGILGFTDILTGQNARRDPFGESDERLSSTITAVRPLAWLRDGHTLFYEVSIRGEGHPRYYFGKVWPMVSPREETFRRVGAALRERGLDPTAAALVDDNTVSFAQDFAAGSRVREWDIATESFLGADRSFQLPETITTLTADPSGMHFLAVTAGGTLYRWSVGDLAPTKLANGVSAAAWCP